ncbi:hypothetical protein Y88_1554 [Novosphingobium nitrogenifigens DSM 19370]|uniref:DUF418 domain-containing protein n=1 Tax=Novosphingobium nitrogenifigens DSM 19370 TaxID=983920 RepID=F1Z7K8_9SPHN|nr:DUF418 domain-containing protein [Novosphingobium nitrogenifigens]EGD59399.1 hypothetical protein Y88_1554 [Novosphingobium nitrogenifigens DSM 19370]
MSGTRIAAIDFVRGVALLGILTINVTGFWGPTLASFSPHLPHAEAGGDAWFLIAFVLFEGKMRALFTLLFGASMLLFIEAAERRGARGAWMQARRLLWLALFGYAHYLLLWWGDILFPYALCGLCALLLYRLQAAPLAAMGLALFLLSHGLDTIGAVQGIAAEQAVLAGHGLAADRIDEQDMMMRIAASLADDRSVLVAPFLAAIRLRLSQAPWLPFQTTVSTFTETLPLMLIGMGLYRSGLWNGAWSRRALKATMIGGIGIGGALTLGLAAWIAARDFPPRAMFEVMQTLTALPHLLMALGYAAGLMRLWPRLAPTRIGVMLAAAGRCAFTNYLGTTILMTAIFSGWGLGLAGWMPRGWLPLFIPLGWAAMLCWPQAWLARHRQGPFEAVWRALTWWGAR